MVLDAGIAAWLIRYELRTCDERAACKVIDELRMLPRGSLHLNRILQLRIGGDHTVDLGELAWT